MSETKPEATAALRRARSAHHKFQKAEKWRSVRNVEILNAHEAGATQAEIAEALGVSQQNIASILKRTGR